MRTFSHKDLAVTNLHLVGQSAKKKRSRCATKCIWLGISRWMPSRHYSSSCRGACICCIVFVHASQTTLTCSHYLPGLYVELFFVREVAGSLVFPATPVTLFLRLSALYQSGVTLSSRSLFKPPIHSLHTIQALDSFATLLRSTK